MVIVKQVWHSTGSSGGLTSLLLPGTARDVALYIGHSTLASTQSASLQSAINSTGPWFVEGSTQIANGNVSTVFKLTPTGPVGRWVRPYLHSASTGDYDFMLIGYD